MAGSTAQVDVALMLVVLGMFALVVLAVQLSRAAQPARPTLPEEDCPPPGLGRLVPVGRQVDHEFRRGLVMLELWLASHRRP